MIAKLHVRYQLHFMSGISSSLSGKVVVEIIIMEYLETLAMLVIDGCVVVLVTYSVQG